MASEPGGRPGRSPFLFACDARGRDLGWALVTAPVTTRAHHHELARLTRAGYRFAGATAYLEFPGPPVTDERDYGELCEGWLHCFRDPERRLPRGAPAALVALSDFTDHRVLRPGPSRSETDADVVYVGSGWPWKREAKNWELAGRCLPLVCEELGVRALVIGSADEAFPPHPAIELARFLPWPVFLERLRRARVLFAPAVRDPSPRVIAEALCLDVPVVVNRGILGGWHYVDDATGVFFTGEDDVVAAVRRCLAGDLEPRASYARRFGPERAGARALALLRSLDPGIVEPSHLTISPGPAAAARPG